MFAGRNYYKAKDIISFMKKEGFKIYLGADHAGFELKEKIKEFLSKKNIYFEDLGCYNADSKDDYPDFAFKVGEKVIRRKDSKGILICGSGIGMCIAANKIKGIRAAFVLDSYGAKMSREHNDANVLCLRGREFSFDKALELADIWLKTKFSGEERHRRRIRKIGEYEEKN